MTTPYMLLTIPTPTVTPGPTYAFNLAAALALIDSHDHSTGKGAPIANNLYLGLAPQASDPLAGVTGTPAIWLDNSNVLHLHTSSGGSVPISGGGGLSSTVIVSAGTYAVQAGDQVIIVKNQGCVVSLPAISGVGGRTIQVVYDFENSFANFVKILPNGADTVAGQAFWNLSTFQQAVSMVAGSDNNWNVVSGKSWTTDWVNVRDFGAVGDGVSDDTSAIQAAINYAGQIEIGNGLIGGSGIPYVYFPHGTYRISQPLVNVQRIKGERSVIFTESIISSLLSMGSFRTKIDGMCFYGGLNQVSWPRITGDQYIENSEFTFDNTATTQYVQMLSGAGSVGCTINTHSTTVSWSGSDADTCISLAAAINANSLVNGTVLATAYGNFVILVPKQNYATLVKVGTGVSDTWVLPFLNTVGQVNLSSASGSVGLTLNGTTVTVAASGGDAATATAMAAAFNGNATFSAVMSALAVSTAVVVTPKDINPTVVAIGTGTTVAETGGSCIWVPFEATFSGSNVHVDKCIFNANNYNNVGAGGAIIPSPAAVIREEIDEFVFSDCTVTSTCQYAFIVGSHFRCYNIFGVSYYPNNVLPAYTNPYAWFQATNATVLIESGQISDGGIPLIEWNQTDDPAEESLVIIPSRSLIIKDVILFTQTTAFIFNELPDLLDISNIIGISGAMVFGPNITDEQKYSFLSSINSNFKVDGTSAGGSPIYRWYPPGALTGNLASTDANAAMIVAHTESRITSAKTIPAADCVGQYVGTAQLSPGSANSSLNVSNSSTITWFGNAYQAKAATADGGFYNQSYQSGLSSAIVQAGVYTAVFSVKVLSDHVVPCVFSAGASSATATLTRGEHYIRVPFAVNKVPTLWATSHAYSVNDIVYTSGALSNNSGNTYICIAGGTSSTKPTGAAPPTNPIVDGSLKWVLTGALGWGYQIGSMPNGANTCVGMMRIYKGSLEQNTLPASFHTAAVPTTGFWQVGDQFLNENLGTSNPIPQWLCTASGSAVAEAWTTGHTYAVGDQVTSNSHVYKCILGGVAGASAPTTQCFPFDYTISPINDGTDIWQYVGSSSPLATFADSRIAFSAQADENPVLIAYRSTTQAVLNATGTIVVFDTIVTDTASGYVNSSGLYTIPVTGNYLVTASVAWDVAPGATGNTFMYVGMGGFLGNYGYTSAANLGLAQYTTISVNAIVKVTAGVTIQIFVSQNSGSTQHITANQGSSFLCVHRLAD